MAVEGGSIVVVVGIFVPVRKQDYGLCVLGDMSFEEALDLFLS